MVTLSPPKTRHTPVGPRIEILGVFGSGKTTLAKRLCRSGPEHLAEDHRHNPFWGDAAAISVTGYLPYDLAFLVQHAHLASGASPNRLAICDWSFATDRLWASMRVNQDMQTYEAAHRALTSRLGPPRGYLYLRQPVEVILQRLAKRARQSEESFRTDVGAAYERLEALTLTIPSERLLVVEDDFDGARLKSWLPENEGDTR